MSKEFKDTFDSEFLRRIYPMANDDLFKELIEVLYDLIMAENTVLNLTGNAFQDGQKKGRVEGMLSMINRMELIKSASAKQHNVRKQDGK